MIRLLDFAEVLRADEDHIKRMRNAGQIHVAFARVSKIGTHLLVGA